MRVGRSCTADKLVEVIEALVATRGAPEYLRMDNRPETIAWALSEWCRLSGTRSTYIEPGDPWENPFVESFNGRVRDQRLNVEEFADLQDAHIVVEAWRVGYNTFRPHSAWTVSPPTSTPSTGPSNTNQNSRSSWTYFWGPLSHTQAIEEGRNSGTGSFSPLVGQSERYQ